MNIARVMICCTLLLSASWFAQPASAQDELPGIAQVSHFGGLGVSNPWGTRSGVSSVWGDGRGWDDGSTTFFIRQPFSVMPEQFVILPEARGNILHTGDFSGNLGVTGRYFDYSSGYVFGLSGWYDHDISSLRDFQNAFTYHQLGLSAEALGPVWDFRANAYIPLDEDPNVLANDLQGLGFSAFSLVCQFQRQTETALRGGDFEIGGNVIDGLANWGIRPYVGAYYYEGEEADQAIGVKARLEALITQDFALEGQVTNDRLFGTHVTMGGTWTFGSGQSPRWFTRQRQVDRLYAQVERNYRLALFRQLNIVEEQAFDPATGDPLLAFHIDNTAAPGGNGSAEAPLNFLPESVPAEFDIIFVHRGDGTNNNQAGGINLFDFQRFLGEGALIAINTDCGLLPLPGAGGSFPTISNFNGSAVTLANGNEVAGFNITDSLDAGITGTNITDFNIHDVNIFNNSRGIVLTNASGTGIIRNAFLDNNPLGGVLINNTSTALLTLDMQNVNVQNSVLGPGIEITADDSDIFASITASSATNSGTGLHIRGTNTSSVLVNSTGNNFSGNIGDGMLIESDNSLVAFNSVNDTFDGNQGHGVSAGVTNFGIVDFNLLAGSTLNGNALNGFNGVLDNGTLNLTVLPGHQFNGNGLSGIHVQMVNGSTLNFNMDQSEAITNGLNGLTLLADASVINSTINASTLGPNGLNGVEFGLNNGAILNSFITNSILDGNPQHGVLVRATNSTVNEFQVINSSLSNNLVSGAHFELVGSTVNNNVFHTNQIVGNTSFGIVFSTVSSVVNSFIGGVTGQEGNVIRGNGDAGLAYYSSGAPLAASNFFIGHNQIADTLAGPNPAANGEGVFFNLRNTGSVNITADRNLFEGNASHGFQITQIDDSIVNATITNNIFGAPVPAIAGETGNLGNGFHWERQSDAQITATVANNLFNGNTGDGFSVFAQGGGVTPLAFTINDNIFSNNERGLAFYGQANADLLVNMARNQILDNDSVGIDWNADPGIGIQAASLRGTWTDLTIARNGGDGIRLSGNAGANGALNITDSTIVLNGGDGIELVHRGSETPEATNLNVSNTEISQNAGFGFRYNSAGISGTDFIAMDDVTMELNGLGGIDIQNPAFANFVEFSVVNSRIRFNGGRGINAFTNGSFAETDLIVTDSLIQGNTADGIVMVNHTAAFNTGPISVAVILRNEISGNGNPGSFGGLVLASAVTNFGGVFADVEDNTFTGNFGDDFVTVAYRAIVADPGDTQTDPTANLDLQFRNNSGESIGVLNFNNDLLGLGAAVADQTFYDNSSNVKSPNPPFVNTRRRNAVRTNNGLGPSTFRVENDVLATNAFPDINEFTFSVFLGNQLGELDYEWEFVPVGTLFP